MVGSYQTVLDVGDKGDNGEVAGVQAVIRPTEENGSEDWAVDLLVPT